MGEGIAQSLLEAWLAGRSLARGLPAPVADRGGWRVDTASEAEFCRWVFPAMVPGIAELGRLIAEPRRLVKLCGTVEQLAAALPDSWSVTATGFAMRGGEGGAAHPLPPGYTAQVMQEGAVTRVTLHAPDGIEAARGYAAETADAFVYDRIVTDPRHRRRGLGLALMGRLRAARRTPDATELLVATPEGHALYTRLGWQTLAPYSTAASPGAVK